MTSGSIEIGGVSVKDMPLSQLSEYVSFVTQDNFLFRCSLLENIRLGNPSATDEEVKAAAGRRSVRNSFRSFRWATTLPPVKRASACPAVKSSASPLPA